MERPLSEEQRERYRRHIALDEVGEAGQSRLLAARVLVVGVGGLGSAATLYLAAAGVGTLGLVDPDVVELSNLQRQVLHASARLGRPKAESGAQAVADLNPEVKVLALSERLDGGNATRLVGGYDVVVDGTDNFLARYLLSDAAVRTGVPLVHGSIFRFEGQVTTFVPSRGPCYRCLYPEPPPPALTPSGAVVGLFGVLPGVIGVIQATEAIKCLLGLGDLLVGRLLCYDALRMRLRELRFDRDPSCPACGPRGRIGEQFDYERFCHVK